MKIVSAVSVVALCAMAVGCIPNTYHVTYNSYPSGAVISQNGKVWGRAPFHGTYNTTVKNNWVQHAQSVTCTWQSGASVSTGRVEVDLRKGNEFTVSCNRPADVPGIDVDLQVSDKVNTQSSATQASQEQLDLQRRQANAAEGTETIQVLNYVRGK